MIFALVIFACGCASSDEFVRRGTDLSHYRRIAIWPLTDFPTAPGSGLQVADFISMNLLASPVTVVDRSQLSRLLAEQSISEQGLFDENTASRIGAALGVDAFLTGSVNQWSEVTSNLQVVQGAAPAYITISTVGFSLKLVDVKSGLTVWSGSARGSQSCPGCHGDATRKAASSIVKKLAKHLR